MVVADGLASIWHQILGSVSLTMFVYISNSLEISPYCDSISGHQITAVLSCTKFCSDRCVRIEVRVKRKKIHRIGIPMETPLVKRSPGRITILSGVATCAQNVLVIGIERKT